MKRDERLMVSVNACLRELDRTGMESLTITCFRGRTWRSGGKRRSEPGQVRGKVSERVQKTGN